MADIQFPVLYVRWKVNTRGKSYTVVKSEEQWLYITINSDVFRFQNVEVYLHYQRNGLTHCLGLINKSHPRHAPFNVSVHVESERTGNILPQLSTKKRIEEVSTFRACIWKKTEVEIARVVPEFYEKHELNFLVILKANDISTETLAECMHLGSERICPSTFAPCWKSLSEDFSKMLSNEQDSNPDVEIQCGSVISKAHKLILCARSPVFQSMLNTDMVEGQTGVLKVDDMDAGILNQFLTYLYTGAIDELTFESAMGLYEAGDKYAVLSLARLCSEFLKEQLTVENVCDVLIVADAHSDATFVEAVIAFILDNEVLLMSDRWSAFCEERPRLGCKVTNQFIRLM